jgi:transcriptional regulator with PAS, ATPase and Fis domain
VIAATNRDLEAAIAAGTFRSDMFYRLNVFPIEMPSLRERREDIPLLVEYFIDRYARKAGKSFQTVNKRSLDLLQSYPWPGNMRELQNVMERSVIVCETENFSVDASWLSRQPLATEPKVQLELSERLAARKKEMIEAALRESEGRVSGPSGAAAKLGIHRSTLDSKIVFIEDQQASLQYCRLLEKQLAASLTIRSPLLPTPGTCCREIPQLPKFPTFPYQLRPFVYAPYVWHWDCRCRSV